MGKTGVDGILVHWFADTREKAGADWKVVTTAGVWRQLQHYLWPEVHKWSKRLVKPLRREALLTMELKFHYGQAFPVASDDPANIEGAHADEILYIIDEAKNVPPDTWDAIEGAMASGHAYCLANSTPGKAEGRLYEIHAKHPGFEDWVTKQVSLEDAIECGRISADWAAARARQWGIGSAVYINRVLGQFSTIDSDGVIPLEWLEAAQGRWEDLERAGLLERDPLIAVAADVASEVGVDKTNIGSLYGPVLARIRTEPNIDTMSTTGIVKGLIDADMARNKKRRRKPLAVIDAIGVGTGVVDRLREQGVKVDAFQGSSSSTKSDRTGELVFLNRRAEAYWHLRDLLNPVWGSDLALPPAEVNPELTGDLITPRSEETSTGRIKIEDKDEIRKRLGRSPDVGDMVTMAYHARLDHSSDLLDALPVSLPQTSRWRKVK
jgi:hypothetical protein